MNRKTRIYFFATCLGLLSLSLAGIFLVSTRYDEGKLSASLGTAAEEAQGGLVSLPAMTDFAWDEVYFFGPYQPKSGVCDTLRIQVKYCDRVIPFESMDDGEMTLAFLQKGRVVRYVRHERSNGDFLPLPEDQPIPPARAKYRVVETTEKGANGKPWIRLVLAE